MEHFSFLRKPTRIILYGALFLLMTTVAMLFLVQYMLDGMAMDNFVSNYAYVGTVYSHNRENPFFSELPEAIVAQIKDSEYVSQTDARSTYSAKAEGLANVPDVYMTLFTMNNFVFVEGIVSERPEMIEDGLGISEYAPVKIVKTWAGNTGTHQELTVRIVRDAGTWIPELKVGDHIFCVGMYSTPGSKMTTNKMLYLYQMDDFERYEMGKMRKSSLIMNSLTVLPEGLSDAEAESYIMDFMTQNGIYEYCRLVNEVQDVFTVRAVSDMGLMLATVKGELFLTEGRELKSSDAGSKVCVMEQSVANVNGLKVGDSISLALAEDCYVSHADYDVWKGWESGYPQEVDKQILEYGQPCEYEIVGIYTNKEVNLQSGYFQYSKNDIFIPKFEEAETARPYTFSFRVPGPEYETFMDEMEVALYEQGYTMTLVDAGWETVQESYYAMESRRGFLLGCAVAAFVAAVVSMCCLLTGHFRYEYGLCRMLGAFKKEAAKSVWSGFAVVALPAGALSVIAAFLTYEFGLKKQMEQYLSVAVLGGGECVGMLVMGLLVELVFAMLLLKLLMWRMEKGGLLRLVK